MTPDGRIVKVDSPEDARAKGYLPIPPDMVEELQALSPARRIAWARAHMRAQLRADLARLQGVHPAARVAGESEVDRRKIRNQQKRERRSRAGK